MGSYAFKVSFKLLASQKLQLVKLKIKNVINERAVY